MTSEYLTRPLRTYEQVLQGQLHALDFFNLPQEEQRARLWRWHDFRVEQMARQAFYSVVQRTVVDVILDGKLDKWLLSGRDEKGDGS